MRKIAFVTVAVIVYGATLAAAENEPRDEFGQAHRITIEIAPLPAKGQWVAGVLLENDKELAAITVPLKFGEQVGEFQLDSVLFETRVSYFALKVSNIHDSIHSVLIGLLADLGDNRPPLEAGSGRVARLYFTQMKNIDGLPIPLVIDSTFFPPYNTLELVTASAEAITPIFKTVQVERLTEFTAPEKSKPQPRGGKSGTM